MNKNELETIVENEWLKRQGSGFLRTIPQLMSSGVQLGKDAIGTAVDAGKAVVGAGKDVVDTAKMIGSGDVSLKGLGSGAVDFTKNLAGGVKDAVTNYIPQKMDQVASGVQDTVTGVGNTVNSALKGDALIAPSTIAGPLGHKTWDGSNDDTVTGNAIDAADSGISTYANVVGTPANAAREIGVNAVTNAAINTISPKNPNAEKPDPALNDLEEDKLPTFREFFDDRS